MKPEEEITKCTSREGKWYPGLTLKQDDMYTNRFKTKSTSANLGTKTTYVFTSRHDSMNNLG